jgi:hypothetical protein
MNPSQAEVYYSKQSHVAISGRIVDPPNMANNATTRRFFHLSVYLSQAFEELQVQVNSFKNKRLKEIDQRSLLSVKVPLDNDLPHLSF